MRIRRHVVVAGVVIACTVGAAAVALAGKEETARTPAAVTAAGAGPETAHAAAAPNADSGLGGRSRAGEAPRSGLDTRPVAVDARPAGEVAKAAPASVTYLSDRYRVTPDEATRRLALQELSAPLAARLAATYPDAYAGMWLDQAAGGVLTIAATDPGQLRAAVADVPDLAHVRVVPVRHSLRQLTGAATRLATAVDATAGVDVVVDERANEVVALTGDVIDAGDTRLAGAIAAAGVPARARPRVSTPTVPKACDPRWCPTAPMRGGIRLDVPRDDGTVGGCSVGFNVRARTGAYYLLTAGHCVVGARHTHVDSTWHQYLGPKVPVGVESTSPVLAQNAYPNDYAVMPYQAGAFSRWAYPRRVTDPRSLVTYWCVPDNPHCAAQGSRDVAITGYVAQSAIQVGWVVCATGSAYTPKAGETYVDSGAGAGYLPGTRCGEITGTGSGGIDVRICARPGDSGGPLFTESDGKALGILSHGTPGQGPCSNPDENNSYAPVSTILDTVNAKTGGTLGFQLATWGPLLGPIAP